jgi:hypothetical protein
MTKRRRGLPRTVPGMVPPTVSGTCSILPLKR